MHATNHMEALDGRPERGLLAWLRRPDGPLLVLNSLVLLVGSRSSTAGWRASV